MKVRILGNSIRLRLNQSEVQVFSNIGMVKETISFGLPSFKKLNFVLKKAEASHIAVSFYNNDITVLLPSATAENWAQTEQISLSQQVPIPGVGNLKVLIEKDFKCLQDRPDDDESEMLPNPNTDKLKC